MQIGSFRNRAKSARNLAKNFFRTHASRIWSHWARYIDPLIITSVQLGAVIRKRNKAAAANCDVVYIDPIGRYAPPRDKDSRSFDIADPSVQGSVREFNVEIPVEPQSMESTLIIHATAGFMSVWDHIQDDLDGYFTTGWRQVIIVLIQPEFRLLGFATHSYLLSLLLNNFPRRKYLTTLDVFSGEPYVAGGLFAPVANRVARSIRRNVKQAVGTIIISENNSPQEFSALVISVEPAISAEHGRRHTDI